MAKQSLDSYFDPELQELRRKADSLFTQLKAKKRLYDLYLPYHISLEDIAILQSRYDKAERECQLKRKELGLPYILNDEEK